MVQVAVLDCFGTISIHLVLAVELEEAQKRSNMYYEHAEFDKFEELNGVARLAA